MWSGVKGGSGVTEKDKDFKSNSAEIIADLLSDPWVRRGLKYLGGEEFKTERERIRRGAGERLKNIRDRYRPKRRTPEAAARERELSLKLAAVESEAAELRLRLAELCEEEEGLRRALEEL
jgi:hypothetical protein